MKTKRSSHDGSVLAVIMVVLVALSLLVLSLYHLAYQNARETNLELMRAHAFWLAEAGRQRSVADLYDRGDGLFADTSVDEGMPGTFSVESYGDNGRLSIGSVTMGDLTVTRRILIHLKFLPSTFENTIYAGGCTMIRPTCPRWGCAEPSRVRPMAPRCRRPTKMYMAGTISFSGTSM